MVWIETVLRSPGTPSRENCATHPGKGSRAIFGLLCLLLCCSANAAEIVSASETNTASSSASTIQWRYVYAEGIEAASEQKKPVFLDFFASWCGPCRMMDAQTFTDPGVINKLSEFVSIKIDTDQDPSTAFSYRVSGIPRYLILNIYGEVIADQVGFVESGPFMQLLEDAKKVAFKESDGTILSAGGVIGSPKGPPRIEITQETEREKLFEYLASPDPDLRDRATDELVRRKDKEIVAALVDSLRDPYLGMRISTWKVLRKMEEGLEADFDPWALSGERERAMEQVTSSFRIQGGGGE